MPDYYTHPNGYTVKRDDRGVRLVITTNTGYTSTWIDNPKVDALRDFLLDELGLWRDPETGLIVVTKSDRDGLRLVVEPNGPYYSQWRSGDGDDDYAQAVARWRATVPPPPREPQEGEVWRITDSTGSEHNVVVSGTVFEDGDGGWYISIIPADRRRLLVEADGTLVAGDE